MNLLSKCCLVLFSLSLIACNQSSDSEEPIEQATTVSTPIKSRVEWKTGTPTQTARFLCVNNQRSALINVDYSKYGTLVAKITPSKFKLPLQAVELANASSYIQPIPFHKFDDVSQTWLIQYGDFSNSISTTPEGEVTPGYYSDFTLFFFSKPGEMGMSSTPTIKAEYCPEIVVDLPSGYENYIANDEIGFTSSTNKIYYSKKILNTTDSIYQLSFNKLYPKDDKGNEITQEIFTFTGNEYIVYYPGIDGVPLVYNILDYKKTPGMGIYGSNIYTIIPWGGITIDPSTDIIVFNVYLNLDGIVELYDNNTPDNPNDDILVLSDKYWERFKITVNQYNKNGEEIGI